jgi:galactokinase
MDTGTRRVLAASAYGDRRCDCALAAAEIGVAALRDATLEQVEQIAEDRLRRRARHVVTENARTLEAAATMRLGDGPALGELMNASHRSLRDDYEVSAPALDAMVTLAQSMPGCHGARMTGGGFAGCAVALVAAPATERFVRDVSRRYRAPASQPSTEPVRLYVVQPSAGAAVLSPSGLV